MYRLFIDETGHDHLRSSNTPNEQYLCLMGVILNRTGYADLRQRMNALKQQIFGRADVVLHRREIIDKDPPFHVLRDAAIREEFDGGLIEIIRESEYTAIAALIDKQALLAKYRTWHYAPYNYCLAVIVERYVLWLKEHAGCGDVLAEWRGTRQSMQLERSYRGIYHKGTEYVKAAEMQRHLTSEQIKIAKKEKNVAGLQLADLIAHPARTDLVCALRKENMRARFGQEVVKILREQKYRRGPKGVIEGHGIKVLP